MRLLTEECSEKYLKTLIGRTEMEDALKRLDKLTHEEARMAIAEISRATHVIHESVPKVVGAVREITEAGVVNNQVTEIIFDDVVKVKCMPSPNRISADCEASPVLAGNQLQESIYKWLSPPDPSTNHIIACGTYHKQTATWFFQGSIFQEWKSAGSLLWIHGMRLSTPYLPQPDFL